MYIEITLSKLVIGIELIDDNDGIKYTRSPLVSVISHILLASIQMATRFFIEFNEFNSLIFSMQLKDKSNFSNQ